MGGMVAVGVAGSNQHALALFPASDTEFCPPMAHSAMFEVVLNTGTSSPMRSDTEYNRFVGSTQLISKILNGPPGSPLGLCSGTIITSISPMVPCLSVPQTGQFFGLLPQLLEIRIAPSRATKVRRGNIFVLIKFPPTIFAGGRTTASRKKLLDSSALSGSFPPAPYPTSNKLTRGARNLVRTGTEYLQ